MKAIILSSGKGTRMMPLTKDTPKPMLEVKGEPLIAQKIKLLEDASINEIFINIAYKKDVIINFIKTLDIDIHLVDEGDEPLGTAEGIRNIIKSFDDEEFIVINSDIWTDFNLEALKDLKLEESLAHIVLVDTPDYLDGDFDCDGITSTSILYGFLESMDANVTFYNPHRIEEGYGINFQSIEKLVNDGVSLIISTDCGISENEVILKSANKQLLGETAAKIRSFRPPEPYKGKGVKYAEERIKRKESKKA